MAPTISKETAKTLSDTIGMVKVIDQENKKIQPRYRKMYDGLKGGIDEGSEDEIALYRPQLAKVVAEIDACLHTIAGAQGLMAQLRKDDALMEAKFDDIEKLVKTVVGTRKVLTDQAAAARHLDESADKALDSAKGDARSAEAELAALKDQVGSLMKSIDHVDVEAPKLEAAVRKAFDAHDQKTVTDDRLKLIDFLKLGSAATSMRPGVQKFQKKYPTIDRDMKAQAQWLLDDLYRADERIKELDKVVKELIGLGQVQKINPAQAAKTLLVKDSDDQEELARILKGPQANLEKALDPLAKKYKSTGKAWLAKL